MHLTSRPLFDIQVKVFISFIHVLHGRLQRHLIILVGEVLDRVTLKDLQGLQDLIVLLDNGDFLILEVDLVCAHDVKQGHRCLATQKFVVFLELQNIQEPDDGFGVDHFFLERGIIPYVKLNDLEDLKQGFMVISMHQSVEYVNVVFLV